MQHNQDKDSRKINFQLNKSGKIYVYKYSTRAHASAHNFFKFSYPDHYTNNTKERKIYCGMLADC
jgi:hypothetical protein